MAFTRILNVYVGQTLDDVQAKAAGLDGSKTPAVQVVGTDPSTLLQTLDCEVDIRRSNRMRYNTAKIKIFNLGQELRDKCREDFNIVRVDAGYADQGIGTVFFGQIDRSSSRLVGADWETTIQAAHFRSFNVGKGRDMGYDSLYPSLSYDPGTNLRDILSDVGQILGVPVVGLPSVDVVLPSAFVSVGTMKKVLEQITATLKHNGMNLFYDMGQIVVYKVGGTSTFEAVYLDKNSGLLEAGYAPNRARWERIEARSTLQKQKNAERYNRTKTADGRTRIDQSNARADFRIDEARRQRIRFKALARHNLRPGGLVVVDSDALYDKYFILDDLYFKLNNFGTSFHCEGLASKYE